jgi:hypothetical protein
VRILNGLDFQKDLQYERTERQAFTVGPTDQGKRAAREPSPGRQPTKVPAANQAALCAGLLHAGVARRPAGRPLQRQRTPHPPPLLTNERPTSCGRSRGSGQLAPLGACHSRPAPCAAMRSITHAGPGAGGVVAARCTGWMGFDGDPARSPPSSQSRGKAPHTASRGAYRFPERLSVKFCRTLRSK